MKPTFELHTSEQTHHLSMDFEEKNIKIPSNLQTRGEISGKSYNPETRMLEVVFATEAPVLRNTYDSGKFNEVLSCKKSDVRTDRIKIGPVLDDHNRWGGVKSIVGAVQSVQVSNNECRAVILMSSRDDVKPIIQDIIDGIIRSISVGYVVHQYKEIKDGKIMESDIPTYRAVDWEPKEISFVPMPADIGSKIRSSEPKDGSYQVRLISEKTHIMDPIENPIVEPAKVRTAEPVPTPPIPTPAPVEVVRKETPKTEDQIRADERTRVESIRSAAKMVGITDEEMIRTAIDGNVSLDSFRGELFKRMEENDKLQHKGPTGVRVETDERDKFRSAAADGLILRANPSAKLDPDATKNQQRIADAREFRGMSIVDLARESLERIGVKTRGLSKLNIIEAACGASELIRGAHTISDFPILLGSTFQRTLREAYTLRGQTFRKFCSRGTMPDFRPTTRAQISGMMGDLDKIPESGEYKEGTFTEGGETYKLAKYGKIVNFSWEAMVNDDLSFLSRIPGAMAAKVAQLQSNIVFAVLSSNPVMGDGTALFHANHGNLGTGGALSVTTLTEARKLMRKMKDPNGDLLDLLPKFLLVGPDNDFAARQLTSSAYNPTSQGGINPFAGAFEPIESPRVNAEYYVIADPALIDTIEYSFLDGEEEIHMEQRDGFTVDGIEMKIRTVFGAKALDWRGIVKNAGS